MVRFGGTGHPSMLQGFSVAFLVILLYDIAMDSQTASSVRNLVKVGKCGLQTMRNADKHIDPLPDEFGSLEEAAEFWDTHSVTDYEEFMEPVDVDVDIQRRHFEIEVDEESFRALREVAKKERKPVKQIASEILKQRLRAG
jgi:hypothetical protein